MCLNQSALSCTGTHFIRPSSWGRGSMRPHIYHTNPSGPSPFFTDSMCVIGDRLSYQRTHHLTRLIHFFLHLPVSVLRFLICGFPLALSISLVLSASSSLHLCVSFLSRLRFWVGQMLACCEWLLSPAVSSFFHFTPSEVSKPALLHIWVTVWDKKSHYSLSSKPKVVRDVGKIWLSFRSNTVGRHALEHLTDTRDLESYIKRV